MRKERRHLCVKRGVIPAQAGIQYTLAMDPRLRGDDVSFSARR